MVRLAWLAPVALCAALAGCSGLEDAADPTYESTTEAQPTTLDVRFGLSRELETAALLIDVCDPKRQRASTEQQEQAAWSLIETPRGRCVDPADQQRPTDPRDRPAVLATTVLRELTPCGKGQSGEDASFPADQITATSELVGATGLRVQLVADPSNPTEVEPGTYCGRVIVERDQTRFQAFDISVSLRDRGGEALWTAILLLLAGAIAGVAVRFLNDPISKLVQPYRRYRAIQRWASSLRDDLKGVDALRARVSDVEDALLFLDVAAADAALTELEGIRQASRDGSDFATVVEALGTAVRTRSTNKRMRVPPFRRLVFGMFRVYWVLALVAVVIGVVSVGIVTRYVENPGFAGTQRDWVGLLVFGLAAQVTATTLSESLGRLLPTARSDRP